MKKIGILSQKGGVGKSSLTGLLATEYARAGWKVLIADMDVSQGSSVEWGSFRKENALAPRVDVASFNTLSEALQNSYDIILFDGAPHASETTKEIAWLADLTILPTGCSIMDLNPQIRLAHELVEGGLNAEKIYFVLNKVGNSKAENNEVINYLNQAGYMVCPGAIPEKTAFRKLFREGKSLSETTFKSLKKSCEEVVQAVVNRINELTK